MSKEFINTGLRVMEKNCYRREDQKIPWLFARCWEDVALKEFSSREVLSFLEQQEGCVAGL